MPNIMINEVCNLKCEYCFPNEFVDDKKKEHLGSDKHIKVRDFKEIVNFITKTGNFVGIIGGEPTLHPEIKKIMEYVIRNKKVEKITFFTNGICLDRVYNEVSHPKVKILINLNSPEDIGKERFDKIITNLDNLYFNRYNNRFDLGINIYKKNMDFSFIIEALKRYKRNKVRVGITSPNSKKMREVGYHAHLKELKPTIFKLFKELRALEIAPQFDCGNRLLPCVCSEEERAFLNEFTNFINKKHNLKDGQFQREVPININELQSCSPVIDFTIDKKAVRCFSLSNDEKVGIDDFNNLNEIDNYFRNKYDVYTYTILADKKCGGCMQRKTMSCQGACLAYKMKNINCAKKLIKDTC